MSYKNISSSETPIPTCGPMDILGGQIGKPNKEEILGKDHLGTKIFDETIAKNLAAYQDDSRSNRSHVIKNVVGELLSQGCRFLKYDSKVEMFFELDKKQIRDKVSSALRHQSNNMVKQTRERSSTIGNNQSTLRARKKKLPRCSRPVTSVALVVSASADHSVFSVDGATWLSPQCSLPHKDFAEDEEQRSVGDDDRSDESSFIRMIEDLDDASWVEEGGQDGVMFDIDKILAATKQA